ncbi:MAG TPA: cobalt-precorrin 5A hydrolase [Candidatus Lachnoclostridium stercorigallinarum]|uniref:Cobalt-precorrin 5A hydrolase n=1 Tax=Candidatus Lachnoclostridium stercorigallinarum TaxID=2838634 RepID=A0A9D2GHD3_9FIRM|nr:cobalt-precorrin 5A hydrolase [Candidatus Lachnoclostridium stercorigallinarum]
MRAAVISFTARGKELNRQIVEILRGTGWDCRGWVQERFFREGDGFQVLSGSLTDWTGKRFQDQDALIFVGACGIAVRASAPWVKDKFQDPAVLAADEKGTFVIPLLSGHAGGANRLARELAAGLGAVPVITTATDVNGRFAVDVFAAENGCALSSRVLAKKLSADILAGKSAALSSDFPVDGLFPPEVWFPEGEMSEMRFPEDNPPEPFSPVSLRITWSDQERKEELRLIPRAVVLGMGCRRGICAERLRREAERTLQEAGVDRRAVRAIASADLKRDEEGLIRLAEEWGIPFLTFSAEEMEKIPGQFSASEFVKKTAGVDCVCERAAMAAVLERGGRGYLLAGKRKGDQVTSALAAEKIVIHTGEQK